jgi:hypothetical protein
MALADKKLLISQIAPPLDFFLSTQLIDEFISCERRYVLRDWEPAELDGGQFCEIAARLLYQQDSGNLNLSKSVDDCLKYIENEQVAHAVKPRHNAIHIATVIRTIYKFRSQRGAVHVSPEYSANELDAKFVIEGCKWIFSEYLRLFWNGDRNKVANIIREIVQFDAPCVATFDDQILVQRTDLKSEDELLVLLHYAGDIGFSRRELGKHCLASPSSISTALTRLISPSVRQIIKLSSQNYRLTDLGQKRIRDNLAAKLNL